MFSNFRNNMNTTVFEEWEHFFYTRYEALTIDSASFNSEDRELTITVGGVPHIIEIPKLSGSADDIVDITYIRYMEVFVFLLGDESKTIISLFKGFIFSNLNVDLATNVSENNSPLTVSSPPIDSGSILKMDITNITGDTSFRIDSNILVGDDQTPYKCSIFLTFSNKNLTYSYVVIEGNRHKDVQIKAYVDGNNVNILIKRLKSPFKLLETMNNVTLGITFTNVYCTTSVDLNIANWTLTNPTEQEISDIVGTPVTMTNLVHGSYTKQMLLGDIIGQKPSTGGGSVPAHLELITNVEGYPALEYDVSMLSGPKGLANKAYVKSMFGYPSIDKVDIFSDSGEIILYIRGHSLFNGATFIVRLGVSETVVPVTVTLLSATSNVLEYRLVALYPIMAHHHPLMIETTFNISSASDDITTNNIMRDLKPQSNFLNFDYNLFHANSMRASLDKLSTSRLDNFLMLHPSIRDGYSLMYGGSGNITYSPGGSRKYFRDNEVSNTNATLLINNVSASGFDYQHTNSDGAVVDVHYHQMLSSKGFITLVRNTPSTHFGISGDLVVEYPGLVTNQLDIGVDGVKAYYTEFNYDTSHSSSYSSALNIFLIYGEDFTVTRNLPVYTAEDESFDITHGPNSTGTVDVVILTITKRGSATAKVMTSDFELINIMRGVDDIVRKGIDYSHIVEPMPHEDLTLDRMNSVLNAVVGYDASKLVNDDRTFSELTVDSLSGEPWVDAFRISAGNTTNAAAGLVNLVIDNTIVDATTFYDTVPVVPWVDRDFYYKRVGDKGCTVALYNAYQGTHISYYTTTAHPDYSTLTIYGELDLPESLNATAYYSKSTYDTNDYAMYTITIALSGGCSFSVTSIGNYYASTSVTVKLARKDSPNNLIGMTKEQNLDSSLYPIDVGVITLITNGNDLDLTDLANRVSAFVFAARYGVSPTTVDSINFDRAKFNRLDMLPAFNNALDTLTLHKSLIDDNDIKSTYILSGAIATDAPTFNTNGGIIMVGNSDMPTYEKPVHLLTNDWSVQKFDYIHRTGYITKVEHKTYHQQNAVLTLIRGFPGIRIGWRGDLFNYNSVVARGSINLTNDVTTHYSTYSGDATGTFVTHVIVHFNNNVSITRDFSSDMLFEKDDFIIDKSITNPGPIDIMMLTMITKDDYQVTETDLIGIIDPIVDYVLTDSLALKIANPMASSKLDGDSISTLCTLIGNLTGEHGSSEVTVIQFDKQIAGYSKNKDGIYGEQAISSGTGFRHYLSISPTNTALINYGLTSLGTFDYTDETGNVTPIEYRSNHDNGVMIRLIRGYIGGEIRVEQNYHGWSGYGANYISRVITVPNRPNVQCFIRHNTHYSTSPYENYAVMVLIFDGGLVVNKTSTLGDETLLLDRTDTNINGVDVAMVLIPARGNHVYLDSTIESMAEVVIGHVLGPL